LGTLLKYRAGTIAKPVVGPIAGRLARLGQVALATVALSACAGDGPTLPKIADLNPFQEKQQPLPGRRVPIVQTTESITNNLADASRPITLPPQRSNDTWAQPGGDANNAPGHLALNGSVR
jgi:outer membrane protein assembly factor BamB